MDDRELNVIGLTLQNAVEKFFKEGRPHWWQLKKIQKHNEIKAIMLHQLLNDMYLKKD
jgi:phage gpG-like protein